MIDDLKGFLDEKANFYEKAEFIESDPIQIAHLFKQKQDIEIAAFFTATIAWGKRAMIIKNAHSLVERMDMAPHDFILNFKDSDFQVFEDFKHRTFNPIDLRHFFESLQSIYKSQESLESLFLIEDQESRTDQAIDRFRSVFFEIDHEKRTEKHVSSPLKKSAAKRLNMFLRWMVRPNNRGVDFGIWNAIPKSKLSCPLDVHSGNVARKLGLITRKQNDLKTLIELDTALRKLDIEDPVKYDYALFGIGVFEDKDWRLG